MKLVVTKMFRNSDYLLLFNKHTGLEILSGVNGKPDPTVLELPSLLDIGVMGTCKNKCEFCYQGHDNHPNMKLNDFKSIIDQVAHHVNQVALGGRGDPNKHENFKEIIEYCVSHNIVPNYTTSGIDLTDEEIEISKKCGAVAVSAYDKPHTYDAIQRLINAEVKTNIHMIFSNKSFQTAMDIVDGKDVWDGKVAIENLNAVIFLLFKPQGAGKNIIELRPTEEQLKAISTRIYESKAKFKVGLDSCLVNHTLQYTTPSDLQRMSIDTCEGARMSAYISADMKFMPCSFSNHDECGVLLQNNLKDIWDNSEQFNKFRLVLQKKANCCPLFE